MKPVMCLLIIVVSLFAFAQVSAVPNASGLVAGRKALTFAVAVLQPAPFEFRGIRIGDEIKEAERRFLSWKIPSLSSKPGLCGSDGMNRIETCTDVLDSGEYVNMALAREYGSPDKLEIRPNRNGLVNEFPGDKLRWSKNGQYIKANGIERSVTIGSETLDAEMDALEKGQPI